MLHNVLDFIAGAVCGGVFVGIYYSRLVADYEKAASTVGYVFTKVQGKVTAFKKSL